jgi:hypothetical protein
VLTADLKQNLATKMWSALSGVPALNHKDESSGMFRRVVS